TDDSRVAASAKQALPSAALSTLTASAAIINPPLAPNETTSKGLAGSTLGNVVSARQPRARAVADLGLNIRSDLERRVRSFSASEGNSQSGVTRPHSSMGFHNPLSGSRPSLLPVRPSSYRTRRHSPHSASIRGLKQDTHRLSVVSTGSNCQGGRFASASLDLVDPQSDAASVSSYSSQATEMLQPSPPVSASQPRTATTTPFADSVVIAGKRRAQTMDQQPLSAL
ncbi:hypothetical protein GGF38_004376, partial [Coemansia sp. RSA 25]